MNITFEASKKLVISPTIERIHETIECFLLDLINITKKDSLLEITKIPGVDGTFNLLPVAPDDFEVKL